MQYTSGADMPKNVQEADAKVRRWRCQALGHLVGPHVSNDDKETFVTCEYCGKRWKLKNATTCEKCGTFWRLLDDGSDLSPARTRTRR